VTDRWFGRSIIRSQKRFTYEEADTVLQKLFSNSYELENSKDELLKALGALWKFAEHLRTERQKKGAVMFALDEVKPVVDKNGKVSGFKRSKYTESHQLIEELMLLANREVAGMVSKKLGKKNRLFVYRIHDVPNVEKLEELEVFLRAIGYQLSTGKKATTQQDLNRLLTDVKGKPEERLITTITIRSMAKAVYATKNIGHYGLAFDDYAHFTSPIRRYPDVMVHRTLESILTGRQMTENPLDIEKKAVHASEREVYAAEAERASVKLKQVEYFADLIGEERDGVISGVTEWGIYIEDKETAAEGMARLTSMPDDTYEYNPKKFAAIGLRTKKALRLGDPVRYRVEAANLEERTLDFKMI
jgi:ribonuclease R